MSTLFRPSHPGFSTPVVGLTGQHITSPFGVDRPDINKDCPPHRGVDFSSRSGGIPAPLQYSAGFYGRVEKLHDSAYRTITVRPFHDAARYVQFLHSSYWSVKEGDIIAPWTPLGNTGNAGAEAIHLHIQVVDDSAVCVPIHDCWDRCYIDPTTWPINDHFSGKWRWSTTQSGKRIEEVIEFFDANDEFDHARFERGHKQFQRKMKLDGYFIHDGLPAISARSLDPRYTGGMTVMPFERHKTLVNGDYGSKLVFIKDGGAQSDKANGG